MSMMSVGVMFVCVRQRFMLMRMRVNGVGIDWARMVVMVVGIMSMLMLVSHRRMDMFVTLFVP